MYKKLKQQTIDWTLFLLLCVLGTYWLGIWRYIELPGLYMDAINPDYLAAHVLNPGYDNPIWILPTKWFPILGNLYHGVQNLYFAIPCFWLLGMNVVSARVVHALFGAAIVILVFFILRRISGSRLIATGATLGLSTEIAYLISFRTQNYIILGGMVWLLIAVLLIIKNDETSHLSRNKLLFSGVCGGLAVYGYFVFIFFLPALIIGILLSEERELRWTGVVRWCVGLSLGLLPYALGYLSMGLALGGWSELVEYLKNAINTLTPFSSKFTIFEGYKYAFGILNTTLSNGGNELMIFKERITNGEWTDLKSLFFIMALILLFISMLLRRKLIHATYNCNISIVILLPCSFFIFTGILGQRLWAHHFPVMIPFLYLLGGLVIHEIFFWWKTMFPQRRWNRILSAAAILMFITVFSGNLRQQNVFFHELDHVGGAGNMSNSLTLLANEALSSSETHAYLFPEWGFFMPFVFLTGNRVPYRLDVSQDSIDYFRGKVSFVSIAFWQKEDIDKYNSQLKILGVENPILKIYSRRDGEPAFYLLTAAF